MAQTDFLGSILRRKALEISRRRRHQLQAATASPERGRLALTALRRGAGAPPRIIGEIKRCSPSAGALRRWRRGDVVWLCEQYAGGGAAAISVLCDRAGFGGSVLDLRRAARSSTLPILFKEFVLDELQIALAQACGAHMVLLIVRALSPERLRALCEATLALGLAPVIEAANERELDAALATPATIVGVNARDLGSFQVDSSSAHSVLSRVPGDRIAVHMSGVRGREDFARVADGRADAVLIGESLMRAPEPRQKLAELQSAVART